MVSARGTILRSSGRRIVCFDELRWGDELPEGAVSDDDALFDTSDTSKLSPLTLAFPVMAITQNRNFSWRLTTLEGEWKRHRLCSKERTALACKSDNWQPWRPHLARADLPRSVFPHAQALLGETFLSRRAKIAAGIAARLLKG